MTDALERAARAMFEQWASCDWGDATSDLWVLPENREAWLAHARVALLAFLDADEAMVEKVAVALDGTSVEAFAQARAAIAALREMLEGEK